MNDKEKWQILKFQKLEPANVNIFGLEITETMMMNQLKQLATDFRQTD